jgi:hypothetical protein
MASSKSSGSNTSLNILKRWWIGNCEETVPFFAVSVPSTPTLALSSGTGHPASS